MGEEELDLVVVVGEGGQEVVDQDLDPLAESPEPETEDAGVIIRIGGAAAAVTRWKFSFHPFSNFLTIFFADDKMPAHPTPPHDLSV